MKKKQYIPFDLCYNDTMNTRNIKKRQILFTLITILLLLYLMFAWKKGSEPYVPEASQGHAIYHFEDGMMVQQYLAGEWEFYPDILLYSDEHAAQSVPQYVQVPHRWLNPGAFDAPSTGQASYRLILEHTARSQFGNLVLSLQGFLQNYRVYINGVRILERMPSPYGYQLYPLDNVSGDVELVIELLNSSTGLTVCPEISMIGVHISNMDTTRNILFIIITIFLILFVMFLVFSFSPEAKRLRPVVLIGFLLSFLFILNVIWGTGYLDGLNAVISNTGISGLLIILVLATEGIGFFLFYHRNPEVLPRRNLWICESLVVISLLIYVFGILCAHWYHSWLLVCGFPAAAFLIWCITVLLGMRRTQESCLRDCFLLLAIFAAAATAFLFLWYPRYKFLLLMIPGAIVCVISICFASYYDYQHEALRRTQKLLELEKYANKTQTALLSSQIQPHFLYNTLLTIQELCRFDPQEASRVIVRFSEYLRHNVDFMNYSEMLPFADEEKHIDNFMYIQEVRFQDKLSYSADIQTRDFMIPPLTIQPLIENAVKYGVRGSLEGGYVYLKVFEDPLGIHIQVENSGPGFDAEHVRTDHSLGNIMTRLKSLLNATLTIHSKEGQDGTKLEILIPKKEIRRNETGYRG